MYITKKPIKKPFGLITNLTVENRSPFTNRKGANGKPYGELPLPDSDISFVGSDRQSVDNLFPIFDHDISSVNSRISLDLDNQGFDSYPLARRSVDVYTDMPYSSFDSPRASISGNAVIILHPLVFILDKLTNKS